MPQCTAKQISGAGLPDASALSLEIGLAPEKKSGLECSRRVPFLGQGDRGMPIERLLKEGKFEPEEAGEAKTGLRKCLAIIEPGRPQ
jgi:hypothetical protein